MPDNSHDPIDLAAHRERRARQQAQQRAAAEQATRNTADASSEPGPGEVPCIRCNEPVFGYALRCPHCGVHFSGRAEDFAPKEGLSRRTKALIALAAVALLLAGLSDDISALWWRIR